MTDRDTRAAIFENTAVKAATGLGIGILLGRFVFRRTLPTVLFTTGFGLGMACAEAGPMLTAAPPRCPIPHHHHIPAVGTLGPNNHHPMADRVKEKMEDLKETLKEDIDEMQNVFKKEK